MTSDSQNAGNDIPAPLSELANQQRVVSMEPHAPQRTPDVDVQTEPQDNTVLDIIIQAAYMLPVLGNVMSIGDVARDVMDLCETDSNGQPNNSNEWLWAILVIDAIGIVPGLGNASRPVRLASREAILAFVRGEGIAIVAGLLWNQAGGAALDFVEDLNRWLKASQPDLQRFIKEATAGLQRLIRDPVDGAEQMRLIERNPSWWDVPEHGKRLTLKAFDELIEWLGEDERQRLVRALGELGQAADRMVAVAIDNLVPVLLMLATSLRRHRGARQQVEHNALAITGRENSSQRGAVGRQSTREGRDPSPTPSGCACPAGAVTTSLRPIDYAMGDENLWQTDFRVPGLIDVEWTRFYRSSIDQLDDSELGARWSSPYHLRFEQTGHQLIYIDQLNRALPLEAMATGESRFYERERFTLSHPDPDHYALAYLDGSSELYKRIEEYNASEKLLFRLIRQQERDGRALDFTYARGRLGSITDGAALQLHMQYDEQGLLERIERHFPASDHEPEVLASYHYDVERNLVAHRDARNYQREYRYQHHLLTHYTNLNGLGTELTWAWPGREEGMAPEARAARCIRTRLDDGCEDTHFEYHRQLWYTRVTDAEGVVTLYRYNYHNEIESISHPEQPELGSEFWRWDDLGRLQEHLDGEGRSTRYQYDKEGRVVSITDPAGLKTLIEYDREGLPVRITDPDGRVRETQFDRHGLPIEQIDPAGRSTRFEHDDRGLLTSMTDAAGNSYAYEWNEQGLLIAASDCSQKTTHYRYDHRGHLADITDAAGHRTHYTLDAGGLPLEIHHPDGGRETFEYDGEGNLTRYSDPEGHQTRYRYNGEHLPIERRDPMGQTLTYRYDRLWRLSRLINQNGDRWQFVYDGTGRVIEEHGFDGRTINYQHDDAGWLVEQRESELVTRFKRDNRGRLLRRTSQRPGLLPVESHYGYDALGRLIRAANHDSETRFHFDAADNLIAEVQRHHLPDGSEYSAVTRHTHDALGNRDTTTLPDGQKLAWLRYGSGHVHAMALNQEELIGFERDDLHREVVRHQRGRTSRLQYDPVGRLIAQQVEQAGGRQLKRQWHYARDGLLTAIDDSLRGTTHYGYDPLGRLRQAASPVANERFDFDPAGNLIDPSDTRSETQRSTPATRWREENTFVDYPNAPKLSPAMGNLLKHFAGTHYHYDDYGNLVRRIEPNGRTWQYQYDPEHRLIEASRYRHAPAANDTATPEVRAQYAYDALGRRIWKQVATSGQSNELTVFTWDGDLLQSEERYTGDLQSNNVPQPVELQREDPERRFSLPVAQRQQSLTRAGLSPQRQVVYLYEPESFIPAAKLESAFSEAVAATGTDGPGASEPMANTPTLYYFQTDHLGTPLEVTDEEGHVAWAGHYRAWGQVARAYDGNGQKVTTDNPFRFQGQYHDEETGLHYNHFRYYDPETGRFITQDPIGLMGGENLYQYAPNPTGWVDPLGLSGEGPTRRAEFRAAKRQAGIPTTSQFDTHKYVYDKQYENRTVYRFDSQSNEHKYVVLHQEDKLGRGNHFHGATDAKGDPMQPGRYDQLPGHHPEGEKGFTNRRRCKC